MTPELEDFFRRLRAIGAGPTTMAAIRDGFPQQRRDPAIAVAAVTGREFDNVGSQRRLVVRRLGNLALRRTVLSEHTADPSLGQFQLRSNMVDAGSATRGA
jgi:hypothetical protein